MLPRVAQAKLRSPFLKNSNTIEISVSMSHMLSPAATKSLILAHFMRSETIRLLTVVNVSTKSGYM